MQERDFISILIKNRNKQFLYSLCLVLIGLGFMIIPQSYHQNILILFDALGALMLITGLYIGIQNARLLDIKNSKAYKLYNSPEQVVWIYHSIVISMPFGVKTFSRGTVYLNTMDGKYDFIQASPKDCEELMNFFRMRFTSSTFGHSTEKEQLYRANPELLRK